MPRPGRSTARAVRFSCIATVGGSVQEDRPPPLPAGPTGIAERRTATERQLGRPFLIFSDLAEGDIEAR